MITCQTEAWADARAEIVGYWPAHYEEIARDKEKIPLAPDFRAYDTFGASGELHVVTVRKDGALVGYHLSLVRPHLHYTTTLCAFVDIYWLRPDCRKGMAGVKLFKEAERSLKARGVKKVFTGTKLALDAGRIFERLGWHETERLFTKYIGD